MMHKLFYAGCLAGIVITGAAAPAAAAPNPSGTGPPSQSCQDTEAAGGTTPGHAASSPGSPFNEPGINSINGGIGGQNYSEKSQYDVACFQVSQKTASTGAASPVTGMSTGLMPSLAAILGHGHANTGATGHRG